MSSPKLLRRIPLADTGLFLSLWVSSNDERGFFSALQRTETRYSWDRVMRSMQKFYAAAAAELNELAVEEFKKTRKRPGVSTKRLEQALRDERNARLFLDSFFVGVDAFLSKSDAKYWRQIDEGTTIHVGRKLRGVWGSSLNGRWATSRRGNRYALVRPPYAMGDSGSGKFQPLSTATRSGVSRLQTQWRRESGGRAFSPGMRIRNPIEAERYYHRAFVRWSKMNRPLNLLVASMRAEFGWKQPIRSYDQLLAALT